ncbi:MAG: tetratricopeptide repeat protein [Hyphomicrobiaceae bacterium]|nr:tetratricopeptide repeat protein [Hyphomicrobiaceae bacterium]
MRFRLTAFSPLGLLTVGLLTVGLLTVGLLALGLPLAAPAWSQGLPKPPAARPGSALPKTPAEREKTLSDLYALLATAEDEESAKAIADAIERVWVHSGSATIDLLMERSIKAMNEKKVDLALKLLDNVVELAPDFTEGWNRRAYVHFVQNDIERALGDLRRTLALDPHHFKALDGLAQILREIGQKKAALKAFKELLDVHPYWSGAKQAIEELEREVDGQGI